MAGNQTNIGLNVNEDLHARDISVVQNVNNIIMPADPLAKNIRFKVEKPIRSFIGREKFLEELHKVVKEGLDRGEGRVTVLTQEPLSVVSATGGIGKTETVRRYIQIHEHEYDHIIWIDAEDVSFAKGQFNQLAMRLKISTDFEGKPKEFELILTEIFEKLLLNAHVVLLVFDNAEALEDDEELNLNGIKSLRPKSLSPFFVEPTIIVTSRNQNWSLQKVIHLDLWTEAEVVMFVFGRLELEKNSENKSLALHLGKLFGRLPIALQAAVAVILQQTRRQKNYGIQSLIDEYESGSRKVLAQKPLDANMRPTQTKIPMLVLWNISLEKIARFEDGALAIKILFFMSYMSPVRIPQVFLYSLFQNSVTEDSFDNAIIILDDYSLVASLSSDDSDSHSFLIHRMIQDATIENLRTRTTNEGQTPHAIFSGKTFLNEAEVLLKLSAESLNYLKIFTTLTFPRRMELVDTLLQITNHVSGKLDVEEFRDLTAGVAEALQDTNNFTKSIELFERALEATPAPCNNIEIWKKIKLQRMLGDAYWEKGQVQKSLVLFLQVLEAKIDLLGPHNEGTLNEKCRVAAHLRSLERFDEATEMYQEVLQACENNEDTQSTNYLLAKSQYANILFAKGEKKVASDLWTQVLEEQEKDPDSNSHITIVTNVQIADQLGEEGHLEEASKIQLQNIEDATKLLGPFHPTTLNCKQSHATTLLSQEKYDEAAPLLLELLETCETQLGPDHPKTLNTKCILAEVYLATNELDKAEAMLDVEVVEKVLGPEHPTTLRVATLLSSVNEEQGKFQDALLLLQKVLELLEVHKKVLGPNHTDALNTMHTIGALYAKMEENEKAASLLQELLKTKETQLGSDHCSTLETKLTLARVYLETKELEKAEALLDTEVIGTVFDPEDPQKLKAINMLSNVKEKQGRLKEAIALQKKVLEVRKNVLGLNHEDTLSTTHNIAFLYYKRKKYEKAAGVAQELLLRQEEAIGKDHCNAMCTSKLLTTCRELIDNRTKFTIAFESLKLVAAETEKSISEASNSNLQASREAYRKSNPNAPIENQDPASTSSETKTDADHHNDLIFNFMAVAGVKTEIGKFFLQASDWNLEVALDAFFDSSSDEDNSDIDLQDDALIISATDAENQNVATAFSNKTEIIKVQDLEVQVESILKSNQPTTSILFRLPNGTRLRGEFGVSSPVKDLYDFVNNKEQEQDPESNSESHIAAKIKKALKLIHEGNLEKASKMMLQNIEDATKLIGTFDLRTLQLRQYYAAVLHAQKKFDLAAPLLLELLDIEETQLGSYHRSTLETKRILCAVYVETKELDKAAALLDVEVLERVLGPEHPETLTATTVLSHVKEEQGKFDDALALREKVLKINKPVLGPNHEDTLSTMHDIGILYSKMDDYEKAAEVAQELLELQKETFGKDHPDALITLEFLTWCLDRLVYRNNLTMIFMAMTSVDAETGDVFLKASNWNFKAAFDTYRNSNPNRLRTLIAAQIKNNLIRIFMALTGVNAETGESCLQASDWSLEVAVEAFFDLSSDQDIADVDLQDDALIPSAAATNAENQNVGTVFCNESEINQIRNIVVPGESVAESNQPATSILFCLAGGTRFRGQFSVSSTVKDLYKFVNEKHPHLGDCNYALTLYPNIQLTKMKETLEEAKIPKNVALTLKMLKQ